MEQRFFAGRLAFCGKAIFRIKVLCLLGLVALAPAVMAQTRGQEYVLGPGDVIAVTVLRHPEMSADTMTIGNSGRINLPVVGQLRAVGKSIGQLDREITNALRVRLRQPEVTVVLRNARPRQVFVLGAVARPGAYELKPGWRVSEALAMAGGLTGRPELVEGSISRANQKPVRLNVTTIISDSSRAENRVLLPGDTLRLTERTLPISVSGQVQRSGSYNLPLGGNVVDALALAGGALPQAALSRARVKRAGGEVVAVDLYKASVLGDPNSSLPMKAGDVLIIPESDARITVLGAVQKPGFYPLEDGRVLRVAEAIALAGGPQGRSALSRATVRREGGEILPVDLYRILARGDQTSNFELRSNDIVIIPESRGITILGEVQKPGTYNVEEGSNPRLSDILALAGGLSIKPEAARISIARRAADDNANTAAVATPVSAPSRVDTTALLELRDMAQNERVQDGDLITVSSAQVRTVFVSGEVRTPGAFELKEGDGVAELLSRAGGPTPLAALKKVNIMQRDGTSQHIDAHAALREDGQKLNHPLREGDHVVVPKNEAKVLVMQAVNRPGSVTIPEDKALTLGDALAETGGPRDRARTRQVVIFRRTPAGVNQQVVALNGIYNGQLALNMALQSGDVVYVPEGKDTNRMQQVLSGIGILGALF